jgi:hypothetical protein
MSVKEKKTLVMVSTVIKGKRHTKFAYAAPDADGRFRIDLGDLPGAKGAKRGDVIGLGA